MGRSDRGAPARATRLKTLVVAVLAVSLAAVEAQSRELRDDIQIIATAESFAETLEAVSPGGAPGAKAAPAEFFGEILDNDPAPIDPSALAQGGVNLFVAGHRTGAQRYSDFYLTSGKPRRRPVVVSMRLRRADDANFTNRTRYLARRVAEIGRPVAAQLGVATTGEEFLAMLIAASRNGAIANMVVYGHAAPNALFMREDRGFYGSVMEVARTSHIVSGEEIEKDEQLRHAGARDLSDFEQLVGRARSDSRATP
jgi:hypothetical protein